MKVTDIRPNSFTVKAENALEDEMLKLFSVKDRKSTVSVSASSYGDDGPGSAGRWRVSVVTEELR